MMRKFGDKWLDKGIEEGVRWVEIYLYKSFSKRY
jgi:hypothetical protein